MIFNKGCTRLSEAQFDFALTHNWYMAGQTDTILHSLLHLLILGLLFVVELGSSDRQSHGQFDNVRKSSEGCRRRCGCRREHRHSETSGSDGRIVRAVANIPDREPHSTSISLSRPVTKSTTILLAVLPQSCALHASCKCSILRHRCTRAQERSVLHSYGMRSLVLSRWKALTASEHCQCWGCRQLPSACRLWERDSPKKTCLRRRVWRP